MWQDRLEQLLQGMNRSEVARSCGMHVNRISQMIGRGAVPNAIDAGKLCRYLGITVEYLFEDEIRVVNPRLVLKATTAQKAADKALDEALAEVGRLRGSARQGSTKARGRDRKNA